MAYARRHNYCGLLPIDHCLANSHQSTRLHRDKVVEKIAMIQSFWCPSDLELVTYFLALFIR
jgi:hypothetical protein